LFFFLSTVRSIQWRYVQKNAVMAENTCIITLC